MPSPSETCFGVQVWEGLSGGCRVGLTLLERCSQGAAFAVQPISQLQFGALREVWRHARGREHCRGEPGSVLSGGYAPDSARAEGSLIVDEPEGLNLCARESKA